MQQMDFLQYLYKFLLIPMNYLVMYIFSKSRKPTVKNRNRKNTKKIEILYSTNVVSQYLSFNITSFLIKFCVTIMFSFIFNYFKSHSKLSFLH